MKVTARAVPPGWPSRRRPTRDRSGQGDHAADEATSPSPLDGCAAPFTSAERAAGTSSSSRSCAVDEPELRALVRDRPRRARRAARPRRRARRVHDGSPARPESPPRRCGCAPAGAGSRSSASVAAPRSRPMTCPACWRGAQPMSDPVDESAGRARPTAAAGVEVEAAGRHGRRRDAPLREGAPARSRRRRQAEAADRDRLRARDRRRPGLDLGLAGRAPERPAPGAHRRRGRDPISRAGDNGRRRSGATRLSTSRSSARRRPRRRTPSNGTGPRRTPHRQCCAYKTRWRPAP